MRRLRLRRLNPLRRKTLRRKRRVMRHRYEMVMIMAQGDGAMSEQKYLQNVETARLRIAVRRELRELEDVPLRDFYSTEALFAEIDRRKAEILIDGRS